MTRPVRFVAEYALAAAAAAVVSALINWDTTLQTSFPAQQGKMWLTRFTSIYLQWLVMRRHFGWASQWALASLGEYAFSGLAGPLMTWLMPLIGQSLAWFPTRMLLATPQAIVLASRARLPWLWPVVQAALSVGVGYVTAFWRPAYPQPMSLGGRVASGALAVLSAALGAAVLAWMCRDELERNVEHPPAATATRLEFLIGWVAMHLAVIAIVMATPEQVIGRALILHVAIVVYSAAYIIGVSFVLSTTGEDWKAWLPAPSIAAAVILVASLTPVLYLIYIQLLSTKWAVLGLALSLSQWFAIRRWSWGVWWLLAVIVGWSSAIWLPRMVNAAVGPGQLYRYPLADTPGIYAVAGLLTGLALIVEMRRGTVFAK